MGKILIYVLFGLIGSFNLLHDWSVESNPNKPRSYSIGYSGRMEGFDHYLRIPDSTSTDSVKSCSDCHADHLEGEVVHPPARKDCERCHISNGTEHPLNNSIGFDLKQPVPALCYECHDPKNEDEFVHVPAGEGNCALCHDFHRSENLYLVKSSPVSSVCYECHDLKLPKGDHLHGAVANGECTGCHDPHQADNNKFIDNMNLERLCKKCHSNIKSELRQEHVHEPFKQKDCFTCHKPHSSREAHLSDLKTKDLCLGCHEDVKTQINGATLVHGAIDETESCLGCHSPHATDREKMLKLDSVAMCLNCHNEEIESNTGRIEAIGPHLQEGYTVHGAIGQDGCLTCHKPHVSEEHSLLNEAFPEERYVNSSEENFALCFKCHSKDLIQVQKSSTVTKFRDGEENLHFRHIGKGKGRNCSICHDMHGSVNKSLIKQKTLFGTWDMPINYESSLKGGTCRTGCHDERKYNREYAVYKY